MGVVPMFGVGVVGTSSHRIRVVDNERDCNIALRAADSEAIITGASGRGGQVEIRVLPKCGVQCGMVCINETQTFIRLFADFCTDFWTLDIVSGSSP